MTDEVARTGAVPLPPRSEQLVGGHAVVAAGYDDSTQQFIVRNSWGDGWGQKGYCMMPYGYLTDPQLARDFWAIYTVEKPTGPTRRKRPAAKRTAPKRTTARKKRATAGAGSRSRR